MRKIGLNICIYSLLIRQNRVKPKLIVRPEYKAMLRLFKTFYTYNQEINKFKLIGTLIV